MLDVISIVLNLSSHALQPSMWSWRMFRVHLKRMCILLLSDRTLYMYQLSPSDLMCHLWSMFPNWFFSLANLSIDVDRMSLYQGSLHYYCVNCLSPFMAISICLIYWGAPMPKPLTVWITINCGKFWKRWEYQTTWSASWEICMQVRKQQLELDIEQQTGSK